MKCLYRMRASDMKGEGKMVLMCCPKTPPSPLLNAEIAETKKS